MFTKLFPRKEACPNILIRNSSKDKEKNHKHLVKNLKFLKKIHWEAQLNTSLTEVFNESA